MSYYNFPIWHTVNYLFSWLLSNPEFFLACHLQLFFIECSSNLFTIEIGDNVCPWYCTFHYLDHKGFFRPICNVTLCKNICVFWYFKIIYNFEFRVFVTMLNDMVITYTRLNISRFSFLLLQDIRCCVCQHLI